jgi:hypothetical protein
VRVIKNGRFRHYRSDGADGDPKAASRRVLVASAGCRFFFVHVGVVTYVAAGIIFATANGRFSLESYPKCAYTTNLRVFNVIWVGLLVLEFFAGRGVGRHEFCENIQPERFQLLFKTFKFCFEIV